MRQFNNEKSKFKIKNATFLIRIRFLTFHFELFERLTVYWLEHSRFLL
jgi:hypothetical protein